MERFDYYGPAYRFGEDAASECDWYEWHEVEPDAHRQWDEQRRGGKEFKEAIRCEWSGT